MCLNDLAMEVSLNPQTENSNSTRFCVTNPTADKIRKWDLPSLFSLNTGSMNSDKMAELHVSVATQNVSIVCISETWFNDYMDLSNFTIQGFCLERKYRGDGRAGGVAYIKHDLMYKRLKTMEIHDLEVMCINLENAHVYC